MRIEVVIDLPTPPDVVWEYVSDLRRGTEWMADAVSIELTTDSTSGVGTAFECVTKVGPLKTTDLMTVTEWEPPRVLTVEHSGSVTGSGRFTLDPTDEGTRLRWSEHLTLPLRFGGALAEPVAKRVLRKIFMGDLHRLRAKLMERADTADKPDGEPEPGQLLGSGHNSELRTYGERVVRISVAGKDLGHEAAAMEHVRNHGFPVAQTFGQPEPAQLVMERLSGSSMLDEVLQKPWLVRSHAKKLASLHRELGEIEAPAHWPQVSDGTSVCHLDFHPNNVRMTPAGPVVTHWENAGRGNCAFDAAVTYTILRTSPAPGGAATRAMVNTWRRQFARAFLTAFGEDELIAQVCDAAELRLLSRDLMPAEREAVFALARGELE